jgi:hypothetical protein
MYDLDWGCVTPESSNLITNTFTYVFNHSLSSPAEVNRTIRFVVGRLLFYDHHLPPHSVHHVKIDARGQSLEQNAINLITKKVREMYKKPNLEEVAIILKLP